MNLITVILCGGQGTRLRPIVGDSLTKCLAPVAGRPFLHYVLDYLKWHGVQRVVLCIRMDQWGDFDKQVTWDYRGMMIDYSYEEEPLGTVGALKNALPLLDSDLILILNGDTYCPIDLSLLVLHQRQTEACTTIVIPNPWKGIDENCGVYLMTRREIEMLPNGSEPLNRQVWFTETPPRVYATGVPYLDIGTPEGYKKAEQFLREVIGG